MGKLPKKERVQPRASRLLWENRRLQRENQQNQRTIRHLRRELARLQGQAAPGDAPPAGLPEAKLRRKCGVLYAGKPYYPLWLWHCLSGRGIWGGILRAGRLLRSTLFLRRVLAVTGQILLGLETGALFLLAVSVGAILFPAALLLSGLGALTLTSLRHRAARHLAPSLRGRTVLLLDARRRTTPFFLSSAAALAAGGRTVLLVGAPLPRRCLSMARLSPRLYALRPGFYYYLLRRRFFSPARLISVV